MRNLRRRFLLPLVAPALVAALTTCADSRLSSPKPVGRGPVSLNIVPTFSGGAANAAAIYHAAGLDYDHVHVVVTRLPSEVLKDTTVAFNGGMPELTLDLTVLAVPGEVLSATLEYVAGSTVLFSGTSPVTAHASSAPAAPPTPIVIVPVAPGAAATSVVVSPQTGTFPTTAPVSFTARAFGPGGSEIPNAIFAWSADNASVGSISANGVVQPTTTGGTLRVRATTVNGTFGEGVVQFFAPPARIVSVSGGGQTGEAGTALPQPFVVEVQTATGAPVPNQVVTFASSGDGSVAPVTMTTGITGRAQATMTLGTTPGSFSYTALTGAFSTSVTATATPLPPSAIVAVSGGGQTDTISKPVKNPLVVRVTDRLGNAKSGVTVSWSRTGTGSLSAASTTTGTDGQTSVSYTLGPQAGTETVTASVASVTGSATFSLTAVSGGVASVSVVSGNNQTGPTRTLLGEPLVIVAADAGGNPVAGATVVWTGGAPTATIENASTTTDASGHATARVRTGVTPGTFAVTATINGRAALFGGTVVPGPAAVLVFTGQPSNAAPGATIAPPVTVSVRDIDNNVVTTATSVTLALTGGTSGAVLGGTTTRAASSGIATFNDVSVNLAGTGYALVASATGLTSATSSTFNVTTPGGTPTALQFSVQPSNTTSGAHIIPAPTVRIVDASNAVVTTATNSVTLSIEPGTGGVGGSLSGTVTVNAVNGVATFPGLSIATIGTGYRLRAVSSGLTLATSSTFDITAAAPTAVALQFGVQPSGANAGATISPSPTVRIVDGSNALVTTATNSVTLSIEPGTGAVGGTLSGTATVAAVNGIATFPGLSISPAGAGYQLRATATGLTQATSTAFTITSGAGGAVASTTVTPTPDSLFSFNQTLQLVATARNASNAIIAGSYTWVSRNPSLVTVSASGLVTSVANGTTYVVATETGGTKDSARVTVEQRVASVNVTPGGRNIYLTRNFTFTATAVDGQGNTVPGANTFTWTSVTPSIATVNASGVVTAVALGSTQIRATTGSITGVTNISVITPITRIEVGRDSSGVPVVDNTPLTALGIGRAYRAIAHDTLDAPMTGITFTWASTNGSVAILDTIAATRAHALSAANGVTAITASAQGVTGSASLTVQQVLAAVEVTPPSASVAPNGTVQLVARGKDSNNRYISGGAFTYATDAAGIATVNGGGMVTGVANGTAHITATSGSITSPPATITVSNVVAAVISFGRDTLSVGRGSNVSIPILLSRPNGTPVTVNLAARDTNAYFSVASVTIPANATSVNVTLNGRNAGTTQIYATDGSGSGYAGDTAVVAVTARIQFAQSSWSINNGDQVTTQLLLSDPSPAGGTYVTYTLSVPGRAQVSPDPAFIPAGQLAADVVIRGLTVGSTTITPAATGVNGTASTLNVTNSVLSFSATSYRIGGGQSEANTYISVPATTNVSIPLTLVSTDSSIVVPLSPATIPGGNNYTYFQFNGLQPGTARIIVSATGWTPDTLLVIVTTPKVTLCCTTSMNTTSPIATITAYTRDTVNSVHNRINSLVVRVSSSDTTVVTVLDTVATIAAGTYFNSTLRIRPGGAAGQAWLRITASGHRSDSILVTVIGPHLSFNSTQTRLGVGQYDDNGYVSVPSNVVQPLTLRFSSSNPAGASVTDSVVIPAGSYYQYFRVNGLATGNVTVIVSATGYQSDTTAYLITTPRTGLCCASTLNNFSPGTNLTVYAMDSARTTHARSTPLRVTLTSTDTTVLRVDSAAVNIPANQYYTQSPKVIPVNPGTAKIVASAPGHLPDTISYTVRVPKLSLSFTQLNLGRRQQYDPTDLYASTPDYRTTPLTVTFTQKQPAVDSLPGATVTIATNNNIGYFGSVGRAFGRDTIIVSAPGYEPDTGFIRVTTPKFTANNLPGSATTTSPPSSVNVFAVDSVGTSHTVSDTVVVLVTSSDTNVIRPAQRSYRILKGSYYTTAQVSYVGVGTASLAFSDSAGTGYLPVTTNTVTVTGPSLSFSTTSLRYGMRQGSGPNDVYVRTPNNVATPLTVTLTSTDTRVVTVPATVTIPAGSYYAYFTVTGKDTLGTIQVQATAPGYSAAPPITVQITQPQFVVNTVSSMNTTTPPQAITVYAADNQGTSHYTTENVVVTLISSAPGVAGVDSTTVTIPAGQYYTQAARVVAVAAGTTQISASDPRAAIYHYNTGTDNLTVTTPTTGLSWSTQSLGLGQYADNYTYLPNNATSPNTVTLSHVGTARTSTPATVTIATGTSYTYFRITGTSIGTDSLRAAVTTGPAHLPDTAYTTVGLGRIDGMSGWPTAVTAGDSVQVTLYTRDPNTTIRPVAAATTFTLGSNANIQFKSGGAASAVITSVTVPADQYYVTFWVKGVTAGAGSATISNANYQTYTSNITVNP